MAINVNTPFRRTGPVPIDDSIVLTKAEMLAINDDNMPDVYFAVCKEDGNLYTYSKTATPSAETGKFKLVEGGGGGSVPAKTYTMDWDEANKELELSDGTVTQTLPLSGLQSELTAGTNITIKNNVISATGGSSIQVSTMPAATESLEGNVYQYIGNTTTTFTHGYFYECVRVGSTDFEWERRDVQPASGGSVPAGGTTDQILAKVSDTDGDADWVDDTGKILTKLDYLYGYDESGVPTKTVTAVTHPMGQNMLCIYKNDLFSNFEEFIQAYLAGKFDVVIDDFVPAGSTTPVSITLPRNKASRYQDIWLELQWVDRTDGIAIPGSSRKLDVFSLAYIDGAQYQYNDTIVVSPRCSYFPNYTTNRVNCSVTLNALGNNSFTPYERIPKYIHNLTGRVLTDLKISGKAVPTDWGIAKAGRLTYTFSSQTQELVDRTIDISELGLTSADDYEVLLTITGGGTMDWGAGDIFVYEKTTTRVGTTYRNITSSGKDNAIVDYVIVAKGYGNNSMSGSSSSLPTGGTTGQALVKKSDADQDVEWKTIEGGGSSTIGRWEKIAEYTTSTAFSKDLSAYEMIALTANPDASVSGDAAMMLTSDFTDGKHLQANGYAGKQAVLSCTIQGEYTLTLNGSTAGACIFGYTTDKLSQEDQDAIASKVQITGKIVRDGDELWAGVASSGTLVLSNDITNYGELHFEFQTSTSRQSAVFKVSDINIGESNPTYGFLLGNYGIWGYFTDANHFIISTGSGITIRKIYGYKYTGIGAVGVPDGGVKNQALVKKSDVDGDVGWKYVDATAPVTQTKAVLWSGSATSEIITLADSLENYDMLEFAYANGGRWSSYGTDSPVITRSVYVDDWATDGHVVFGETIGSGNNVDETWVRVTRVADSTQLQVSNHLNSSYPNRLSSLIRVYGVKFEEANVLTAPNGTKYRIKVSNDGTLTTEAI